MKIFLSNILLFLFVFSFSFAQEEHNQPSNKAMERIQQIRKIKLIEVLDLDEGTAEKFFFKDNQNGKKFEMLRREIDIITNELDKSLREGQQNDIRKKSDIMFNKMTELMTVHIDRLKSAKQILPEEKFAKYLVFESKFRKEIEMFLIRKEKRFERKRERR